jgi:hypothetical protein
MTTFQPGDVIRDADNFLGTFRDESEAGVFITIRAGDRGTEDDVGAQIPRRAKPPLTLVASARPACLTCKHWRSPEKLDGKLLQNIDPGDERAGVCSAISIDIPGMGLPLEGELGRVAFAQNDRDASARLRTNPSFGCTLHESPDEALSEFDSVEQTESVRMIRRIVALSSGKVHLVMSAGRFGRSEPWSEPRLQTTTFHNTSLSQEDLALVAAVTRDLHRVYERNFGKFSKR